MPSMAGQHWQALCTSLRAVSCRNLSARIALWRPMVHGSVSMRDRRHAMLFTARHRFLDGMKGRMHAGWVVAHVGGEVGNAGAGLAIHP